MKKEEINEKFEIEDFVEFGLMPEVMGRFPQIIQMSELKPNDMIDILNKSKHSPLILQRKFLESLGVKLNIDDKYIEAVAKRGLQTVEIVTGGSPGNAHCDIDKLLVSSDARKEYLAKLNDKGLEISAFSCHNNPVSPNKKNLPWTNPPGKALAFFVSPIIMCPYQDLISTPR